MNKTNFSGETQQKKLLNFLFSWLLRILKEEILFERRRYTFVSLICCSDCKKIARGDDKPY